MSNLDPKKVWSYNERVWACARIAELEAEKCVLIDQQREAKNILIDKNFHIDSLYEEGYKLQQRIAELEAAQRWIPVSERLPENENDQVLIRRGNVVALGWIYFDELMGDWDYRCYDEDWGGYPTHWMLLPKLSEVQE